MKGYKKFVLALFAGCLLALPAYSATQPTPQATRHPLTQPRRQITSTSVSPDVFDDTTGEIRSASGEDRTINPARSIASPPAQPALSPVPTPTRAVKEPTDPQQALQLALVLVQLVKSAVRLGTLAAVALVALAGTYLLMYLTKTTLKRAIPENYKKLLGTVLGVLTAVAGILGYFAGGGGSLGLVAGGVAALGAAFSGPLHRMIDGVAGLKKPT